jgi:hypothetical protein
MPMLLLLSLISLFSSKDWKNSFVQICDLKAHKKSSLVKKCNISTRKLCKLYTLRGRETSDLDWTGMFLAVFFQQRRNIEKMVQQEQFCNYHPFLRQQKQLFTFGKQRQLPDIAPDHRRFTLGFQRNL